ncbi:MAG: TetR/AcrR family transcriptional regulator [Cyclobacteriaceae bacterium]
MKDLRNNRKYQKILATARDLFWKHGFKRVSIEELCRKAEVSKMTFYKFFPNKIELAKAVFDHEVQEGLKRFKNIVREDAPAQEKIRKIVEMKAEGTNNISKEFLQDFYSDRELGLREYVEKSTREAWTELLKDFKHAQERGSFRGNMKPELLFYISQKMGELVTDETLLKMYSSPQELVLELTNLMAFGISPRDQTT